MKEVLNSIGIKSCAEINKTLMERGLPTLNAEVQANLIGQFSSVDKEDNPIRSLIGGSLYFYCFLLQFQFGLFNSPFLTNIKCQAKFSLKYFTCFF